MTEFKQNPFMTGMTPEQQAHVMKMDGEIRSLLPGLFRVVNSGGRSVNAILAALAIIQAEVIRHCPTERREELYNATQFVLRDTLFGVHSLALPVAPFVDKPKENGKAP